MSNSEAKRRVKSLFSLSRTTLSITALEKGIGRVIYSCVFEPDF